MTPNNFGPFGSGNCESVIQALFLFIDNEISDMSEAQALELHLQQCPPCRTEMEHESRVINQLKNLLASSCCEEAPEELNRRIAAQTALLAAQMSNPTQVITEYVALRQQSMAKHLLKLKRLTRLDGISR